jgi:23S rRNA U2552 (ribose-2'-O)-methylase RlmE/FtsJ
MSFQQNTDSVSASEADNNKAYAIGKINEDYIPTIIELPHVSEKDKEKNIFSADPNPLFSTNIDMPKFSLGFHHLIHVNKDKMERTKEFENKKKVYLVISKFERYIDNSEIDIDKLTKKYFGLDQDKKPEILSRAFFKLWEMLLMFDLVSVSDNNFISAHLTEGPGSFIQATMMFRDKFGAKNANTKNDKYIAISSNQDSDNKHVKKIEKSFVDYYSKEKPLRIIQESQYSKKVNFITADGGENWSNDNIQEQEAIKLLFSQITNAIKLQAKGGNFVCKFYETFTQTSGKLLNILSCCWDKVYVVKPLMSSKSKSEKYAVCTGFKYADSDKTLASIISKLDSILKESAKTKLNIVDIFPNFTLDRDYTCALTKINTEIANKQLICINDMIKFIDAQNYYGEVYKQRQAQQVEAAKYWGDRFLISNIDKDKNIIIKQTLDTAQYYSSLITQLKNHLKSS